MKILFIRILILTISFYLPIIAQISADTIETCDIARRAFVIWETKAGPQLAAELSIGVYPHNALMTRMLQNRKQLNKTLIASPEELIVHEFQLTLTADKAAILDNYFGDKAKKYAEMVYHNIQETQKWNKLVADIQFQTKSIFGDTTRIRYIKLEKNPDSFPMPWSSLCEKYNGRYYFTSNNTENSLFAIVSELYPFWDASKNNVDTKGFITLKKATFSPLKKTSRRDEDTNIVIYYNLNQFSENNELKNEVLRLLDSILYAYTNEDIPALLSSWLPERRASVQESLTGDPFNFMQSKQFFCQARSFLLDFYIGDSDDMFAFARRFLKNGDIDKTPKLFLFHRHKQRLYLTDKAVSTFTLNIINNPQMVVELNNQLHK